MFLEEDHYVAEDLLHVMTQMEKEKSKPGQKIDILCLGTYENQVNYQDASEKVSRESRLEVEITKKSKSIQVGLT